MTDLGSSKVLDRAFKALTPMARYAAQTRRAQFQEMLRFARTSLVTHVAVAAALLYFFWSTPSRAYVVFLGPLVAVPSLAAMVLLRLRADWTLSARAVTIGRRCAIALAFVLGLGWGTMPIALFQSADWSHRMIVVATLTGTMASAYVLGPILAVNLAFIVPVVCGTLFALAWTGEPISVALAFLLLIYALFILSSLVKLAEFSLQRIVDRLRVGDQNETIALLLRDFEENASDWLWELDVHGRLRHVPERMAEAAGLPPETIKNALLQSLLTGPGATFISETIAAHRPFRDEIVEIPSSASSHWWRITGKPVENEAGMFSGYRGFASDITESRRAEARIAHLATHDALTDLLNRGAFLTKAELTCADAVLDGRTRALLLLDLDGFKKINDEFGHAAGDAILQEVVARLRAAAPADATLARLGGDEFTIIWAPSETSGAPALAQALIDVIERPFEVMGSSINVGLSVGIAYVPADATDATKLLGRADLALYQSKAEGRGRYSEFREDYETALFERRRFEDDLRLALTRREFELYFQPLASLSTGRVVCFEALLRWTSETRGAVQPSFFIPIAESIGMIVAIGRWALLEACNTATTWPEEIRVAVNISPQHFRTVDFVADVRVALEISGLRPDRLEIEITEGVFLDASTVALKNLQALRAQGIAIALDDFGTGYSSLSYLLRFPVDSIKIDRTFVADYVGRSPNRAVVDTILALGRELNLSVTAEGVETVEQMHALRERGCDLMQGYLLSRPLPKSRVSEMIAPALVWPRQAS